MIASFAFFLQNEADAPAAATHLSSGSSALWEMISNSGPVALAVLILLLCSSLFSWTIILSKLSSFRRAREESRRFLRAFRKASRLQEIASVAVEYKSSPLAQVFEDVYETYKRQTGGSGPPRNLLPLERSAQTAASEAITKLEQRMTWLATIAAVSPFVGLFGTVIGIIDSFHGLGQAGSATLRAVAPGISEALIATAAGLFVAIPAVVAYNQYTARIRVFASAIDDFCRELLNSLDEAAARTPAPARPMAPEAPQGVDRGFYR